MTDATLRRAIIKAAKDWADARAAVAQERAAEWTARYNYVALGVALDVLRAKEERLVTAVTRLREAEL